MVVPDPAESDIRTAEERIFREGLGVGAAPGEDDLAYEDLTEPPPGSERRSEIWPWLVLALLGLMVVENFLSDRRLS